MKRLLPSALIAGCLLVLSATPASAAQGSVKWFNAEKGFGSIAQDGGGADVFVGMSTAQAQGVVDGGRTDFALAA